MPQFIFCHLEFHAGIIHQYHTCVSDSAPLSRRRGLPPAPFPQPSPLVYNGRMDMNSDLLLTELQTTQLPVGGLRPGGGESGRAAATHTNHAAPWSNACKMGKTSYTHDAMIDLLIANPWIKQKELAIHFGYTQAWVSAVFASDAFQAKLAARREEVVNPEMRATLRETTEAIYRQSLERLREKLEAPAVSDSVVLKAMELGARALGIGGNAPPPPPAPSGDRLEAIAQRLVALQANVRKGVTYENAESIDGEVLTRDLNAEGARTGEGT